MISLIQHLEADFPHKILNSGIILKTFTHVLLVKFIIIKCIITEPHRIGGNRKCS